MVTGFAAIGSMVLAGSVAAVTTISFATIAVGVITSAVVGAAVGGLVAAVTGGDIGKGMLFGAIGGVVTGGLAGGAIQNAFIGSATSSAGTGTLTPALLDASTAAGGSIATSTGVAGSVGEGVVYGAGGSMFGGTIGTTALGNLAPMVLDAAMGGLSEEPEVQQDFAKTKEGFYAALKSAEERQRIANEGASGGAETPWASTKEGVTYQREQDYKQQQLQGEQKLQEVDKSYSMANKNAAEEFGRGRKVYDDAAQAVSGGEYKGASAAQKEAIIASQAQEPDAGMLQGAQKPEDTVGGA